MEKFYIAEEGSKLREDYLNHKKSAKEVQELAIEFFKKHGIEAQEYVAHDECLAIVATEKDFQDFGNQLCKPKNGLCSFKVNSKTNKEWIKMLEQKNIKVIPKPMLMFYFSGCVGRISSRLFDIDGTVYCSLRCENDYEPKDKLQEIKGSEFYQVIEDYNTSLKAKASAAGL